MFKTQWAGVGDFQRWMQLVFIVLDVELTNLPQHKKGSFVTKIHPNSIVERRISLNDHIGGINLFSRLKVLHIDRKYLFPPQMGLKQELNWSTVSFLRRAVLFLSFFFLFFFVLLHCFFLQHCLGKLCWEIVCYEIEDY